MSGLAISSLLVKVPVKLFNVVVASFPRSNASLSAFTCSFKSPVLSIKAIAGLFSCALCPAFCTSIRPFTSLLGSKKLTCPVLLYSATLANPITLPWKSYCIA